MAYYDRCLQHYLFHSHWVMQEEALSSEEERAAKPGPSARWWQKTGAIVGMSVSAALILGLAIGAVAYSL